MSKKKVQRCGQIKKPIECFASQDKQGRTCTYRKHPKENKGLCVAMGKNIKKHEQVREKARRHKVLGKLVEEDAGKRLLKALKRKQQFPSTDIPDEDVSDEDISCQPYPLDFFTNWQKCYDGKNTWYHNPVENISRWIPPETPFCRQIDQSLEECIYPPHVHNTPEEQIVYYYDTESQSTSWDSDDYDNFYW